MLQRGWMTLLGMLACAHTLRGLCCRPLITPVNSEKKELEVLGKTFYEITEELYDVAESIKLADELVGDVREVFSNSDDRI